MNTIAILSIVVLAAFFMIVIISLLRMSFEFIKDGDLFGTCFGSFAVGIVCCSAIICFNTLRPLTRQVVCTDYQVEERVDSLGKTTFVITYER